MEPTTYLDHVRSDGAALATAGRAAPSAPVASCPGWDMTALLAHVGAVHHWVTDIVSTGATTYLKRAPVQVEGEAATLAWYEDGVAQLVATLEDADPDAPLWNWYHRGAAPGRFWWRRMAHETAIHRWDGEAAVGSPSPIVAVTPIAAELAVDGMDEFLTFASLMVASQPIAGLDGSLHLHATDTQGEWALDLAPDHLEYRQEHTKSDTAVRGTASDLLLLMLNRIPADAATLQVFGDGAVLEHWRELRF